MRSTLILLLASTSGAALVRPRVIFTDCDGTLLRPDHTLSARVRRTLHQVHEAGVLVVPATGRGRAGAWTDTVLTHAAFGGGSPGVFCNGCVSYDTDGSALPPALLPAALPAAVLRALAAEAAGAGCVAVAYVGDEALFDDDGASGLILRLADVGDSPLRQVKDSSPSAPPLSQVADSELNRGPPRKKLN